MNKITSPIRPTEDVPLQRKFVQSQFPKTATSDAPLIVINMNLWHDWPRHRHLPDRLERFAELVEQEGAQIVLLQEALRTNDVEAHAWLADRLDMQALYHRANGNQMGIGFEEGVAVLSSLPMLNFEFETLQPASEPFVRRVALGVEIELGYSTCWVYSTHLSLLPKNNAAQIKHLRKWVMETSGIRPALIGGDFNADESTRQIAELSDEWIDAFRWLYPDKEAASYTLRWPWGSTLRSQRLDYLFLKSRPNTWRILEASYLEPDHMPYSDHKAMLVRLAPCTLN